MIACLPEVMLRIVFIIYSVYLSVSDKILQKWRLSGTIEVTYRLLFQFAELSRITVISNGNRTEWSTIQGVIERVI